MNKAWIVRLRSVRDGSTVLIWIVKWADTADEALKKVDYTPLPLLEEISAERIVFDEDDVARVS